MLKNIKLIRDRVSDVGHEADLRGLGEELVMTERDPLVVLGISASSVTLKKVESIAIDFDPGFRLTTGKDALFITFDLKKNVSHKEQAIYLFALIHTISSQLQTRDDVSFSLTQANRLQFHMKKESDIRFDISASFEPNWNQFLSVQYPINLFLSQAGFDVNADREGLALDRPLTQRMVQKHIDQASKESFQQIKKIKAA